MTGSERFANKLYQSNHIFVTFKQILKGIIIALLFIKSNMDTVFIQGLKIDTVIGIYDWERKIRQEIVLDIEMSADISTAASTDHIDQTLNYKDICKRLKSFVEESEFQLVETLAEEICQIIIKEFGVQWVKLKLNKGEAITGAEGVGVIIERTRE